MKCEYLEVAAGVVRLTVIFECREEMERFKEVYDQFAALLPQKAPAIADLGKSEVQK